MSNKIFYQAVTQFENTGDLIINRSLIELLKDHGELVVNDLGVPDWYLKDLGVSDSSRLSKKSNSGFTSYLMKTVIYNFFTGKNNIFLVSGPGHFYGNSLKKTLKNIISGLLFWVLKMFGCKIVKCGTSLGPLSKRLGLSEAFRSRFYFRYLIRDSLSLKLANEIGIKNHEYMPDLAWALDAPFSEGENVNNLKRKKIFLSFRVGVIEDGDSPAYLNKLISSLDLILKNLKENNAFESIVVGYQVDRDNELCKKLYNRYRKNYSVELIPNRINLNTAQKVYEEISYVLSNRLHVMLFASKYGALPICVSDIDKHLKIKGIFVDSNLKPLLVDINNSEVNILDSISKIQTNSFMLLDKLNSTEIEYKAETNKLIKGIFN